MLSPKEVAKKKMWEATLEYAVTVPVNFELLGKLTKDLTKEEIEAIPYLPYRNAWLKGK